MSKKRTGDTTITYQLRLYNRHFDWLGNTRKLYNRVVWHYYQILMKELSLLEQSNFLVLRTLEEISIGTKEKRARGEEPLWKLTNLPNIPLYFRRAAINTAIGLARSYTASLERKKRQARSINCSPVFYKGMYREFGTHSIQLKVFNGEKWVWVSYPFTGRAIPENGTILSPTLKLEKKTAYLNVPVETVVEDVRTVKERMEEEKQICAVAFPDSDTLAVCVVMEQDGRVMDSYFIHGGKRREMQRKKVLKRLKKSKESRLHSNSGQTRERENEMLYQKMEQINHYYAHKVSREILNYCKKNQIKLIVVPNYEKGIPFSNYRFLHTDPFHWQGRAMIACLRYKAWKEGILVTAIRPYHISDCCSECGQTVQRYNEGHKASKNYYGGQLFLCPNGHRGNAALNTAKNIGRYFLKRFQKEKELFSEENG